MKVTPYISAALFLILCFRAVGEDSVASNESAWRLGRTNVSITQVYSKDPEGELEQKTKYLEEAQLELLSEADGEEIKCPMYCVIRFSQGFRFRIEVTCRADGNHQVVAFSPRSSSFTRKDFRDLKESQKLTLEFDSTESRYLVLNCTRGNLFIDALSIEKTEGQQDGAGQPATRPESDQEGGDKPQPDSEGRSR